MHTTQTLDLNDARTIIDAGIAEAERIGNQMNIAVVDAGGGPGRNWQREIRSAYSASSIHLRRTTSSSRK